MSAPMLTLLVIGVLAVAGAAAGVVAVVRRTRALSLPLAANTLRPRLFAEVHAGEEQVLIHLARSLTLPSDRDDVGYGEIYIAGSVGMTMRLASRSEIGRGFEAEVRVQRTPRSSLAEYYILRLPGDEGLHARVAALDEQIARALKSLDPEAQVRCSGHAA